MLLLESASIVAGATQEIAIRIAEVAVALLSPIPIAWRYYDILLGYSSNPRGSRENKRYRALRYGLVASCRPLQIYTKLLKSALDKIDSAFGDLPRGARDNFGARLFGLTHPSHVWTAASLDRCLLYALFYPILTVAFIWAVYGDAGVAGAALFPPARLPYERWLNLGVTLLTIVGLGVAKRSLAVGSVAVALVASLAIGAAGAAAIAAALLVLVLGADAKARTGAVILAGVIAIAVALALSSHLTPPMDRSLPFLNALIGALAGGISLVVALLFDHAKRLGHHPLFLPIFILVSLILIYELVWLIAPHVSPEAWKRPGAILLMFGVLTLLNAPFDFLSLGLTRGFLRRGLQNKGLSPIWYAFYDAVAALVVISALAVVLVLAIQLFGSLELRAHQQRTLDLKEAFNSIHTTPMAPQNFWIYALLITTQIPSLFNVAVGAVSVARAFRPISDFLYSRLPVGEPILTVDRVWMVPFLILRVFLPATVGVAAGVAALLVVPIWILPLVDFDLVEQARQLVEADIPQRMIGR